MTKMHKYIVTFHDLENINYHNAMLTAIGNAWQDINELSPSVFTDVEDGGQIEVIGDWSKAIEKIRLSIKEYQTESSSDDNKIDNSRSLEILVEVTGGFKSGSDLRKYSHYVELYLHNTFLAMNLSAPGCFDLWNAKIAISKGDPFSKTLHLSASGLTDAWEKSIENKWPQIGYIPLKDVQNWLLSLNINTKQYSSTRMEKALFSFLHLSKSFDDPFNCLMWEAYSLEALFDTPFAAIKKMLTDRISLVLGTPTKKIRKKIGEFYELRSSFLHGRQDIPHPMENDILDENADKHWESRQYNDLACSIIISTLQEHIRNNFEGLKFNETFEGRKINL